MGFIPLVHLNDFITNVYYDCLGVKYSIAMLFSISIYSEGDRMISSGSTYYLNHDELECLKKQSLNGDSDASYKLYQYFAFSEFNKPEMLRWLRISYSQGNEVANYNYAIYLIDRGETKEALKLINDIELGGDEVSANELKRMLK